MRPFRGNANYGKNSKSDQREASAEPTTSGDTVAPEVNNLSDKQRMAISWLLQGKTLLATADICSINVRTLRRWMDEPDFADQYAKARREQADAFSEMVVTAATAAMQTMIRHLTCGNQQAELRAAKALAHFQNKTETTAFRTTIAELKSIVKQQAEQIQSLEQKIELISTAEPEPQSLDLGQFPAVSAQPHWITKSEGATMLPTTNSTAITVGQACASGT